jgi:spore germination cell wall hydrolase CwlJ-like protein
MDSIIIGILGIVAGLGGLLWANKAQGSLPPVSTVPAYTQNDLYTLARTLWGEARSEGYRGMQAVANVVMNRYEAAQESNIKGRQFGRTVAEICQKPYQFSIWNANDPNLPKILAVTEDDQSFRAALQIARDALNGSLPDITNGADHYHTSAVSPYWSSGKTPIAQIGSHEFYNLA